MNAGFLVAHLFSLRAVFRFSRSASCTQQFFVNTVIMSQLSQLRFGLKGREFNSRGGR